MSDKEKLINTIVNKIFAFEIPKIEESRRGQIFDFIKTSINGDEINTHLVIDVKLNDRAGVNLYILTNTRLIQIQIDDAYGINSLVFVLSGIINFERKLLDDDRIEVQVIFKDNVVGLRYSAKDPKPTEFFQEIEQTWAKGGFQLNKDIDPRHGEALFSAAAIQ